MKREHWEALSACSGWDAMKAFLMDSRSKIMEQIADGKIPDESLKEAIFRCQNLKDLAEMDWETIEKFYRPNQPLIYDEETP